MGGDTFLLLRLIYFSPLGCHEQFPADQDQVGEQGNQSNGAGGGFASPLVLTTTYRSHLHGQPQQNTTMDAHP